MSVLRIAAIAAAIAATMGVADAASLRVAPVSLELPAPQQTASLKIWNDGGTTINVQVRVFRWRQLNGEDVLEPTEDVVVSPPISALAPGGENLIRVVRVNDAPVASEESYRLLVDELPDPSRAQAGTVALVLRHSIPVFFTNEGSAPAVAWHAAREANGIRLTAENTGGRRLRLANLEVTAGGKALATQTGLAGYVLSGASAVWLIPATGASGPITVTAESETGRINAIAQPVGR